MRPDTSRRYHSGKRSKAGFLRIYRGIPQKQAIRSRGTASETDFGDLQGSNPRGCFCQRTRGASGKAFSIKTSDDIKAALASTADYILLDQGNGGTGQTFDWSLVENVDRPFFLAGGLGIRNLEKAIERLSPWAVDLSSSLETEGKKDPEKIKAAVKLVRRIEAQVERT